jgi:hypothetical protein
VAPEVQELVKTQQRLAENRNHRPQRQYPQPPPPEQGQEGQEKMTWVWDPEMPPWGLPVRRR